LTTKSTLLADKDFGVECVISPFSVLSPVPDSNDKVPALLDPVSEVFTAILTPAFGLLELVTETVNETSSPGLNLNEPVLLETDKLVAELDEDVWQ